MLLIKRHRRSAASPSQGPSLEVASVWGCCFLLLYLHTQGGSILIKQAATCAKLDTHHGNSHNSSIASVWPPTTRPVSSAIPVNTSRDPKLSARSTRQAEAGQATTATAPEAVTAPSGWQVRILALFSGSATDLGLDHRLGRQVLKLAVARARRLNPELAHIELLVLNDETDCKNVSSLPGKVASIFYAKYNQSAPDDDAKACPSSRGPLASSSNVEAQVRASDTRHQQADESSFMSGNGSSRPPLAADGNIGTSSCAEDSTDQLVDDEHEIATAPSGLESISLLPDERRPTNRRGSGGSGRNIDVILGPSCDSLVDQIARMAAYWQTPIYTVASVSGSFARKDIYSTLTRLSPSIDHLSMFAIRVMERFEWRHLAIVVDPSQTENMALLEGLEKTIERLRFTEPIFRRIFMFDSSFKAQTATKAPVNDTTTGSNSTTTMAADADRSSANSGSGGTDEGVATNGNEHSQAEMEDAMQSVHCTRELRNTLRNVHRVARVVLLLLDEPRAVRRLLLCAHELRMNNGEYTFLALNLGLKSGKRTSTTLNDRAGDGGTRAASGPGADRSTSAPLQSLDWFLAGDEDNNLKVRQMFESLMVLSVGVPISTDYSFFVEQTLDLAHQDYPEVRFERASVGPIAMALHDSLLLAVEAHKRHLVHVGQIETRSEGGNAINATSVDSIDRDGGSERDAAADEAVHQMTRLVGSGQAAPLMWSERFGDGLVANMHINSRGDQEFDYVLSDMEPELGVMRPVASYAKETRRIQMLPDTYIHWPARLNAATGQMLHNDEPPPDEPECGFTGDAERCVDRQNLYTALLVLASFISIILVVIALSLYRYRKIKYQMQLDDYWWKISWSELTFLVTSQQHQASSINSRCATSLVRQLTRPGGPGSVVSLGAKSNTSSLLRAAAVGGAKGQIVVNLPAPLLNQARRKSGVSRVSDGAASLALSVGTTGLLHGRRKSNISFVSTSGASSDHLNDSSSRISQRRSALPLIVTTPTSVVAQPKSRPPTGHKPEASATGPTASSAGSVITPPAAAAAAADSRTGGGGSGVALSQLEVGSNLMIRSELSAVVRISSLAVYKNELVIVKQLNGNSIEVSRELLVELKSIRELSNENLARLVGLCLEPGHLSIVYEYCSRGNLQDLLLNGDIAIDWNLKYSIIGDIINGLNFVHTTLLDCHGRLKSTNLVLDSRFTVKLTDFGLKHLYSQLELIESHERDSNTGGTDEDAQEADNEDEDEDEDNVTNDAGGPGSSRRRASNSHTIYNMDSVSIRAERLDQRRHRGHNQRHWGRRDSFGQRASRSGVHSTQQLSGDGAAAGGAGNRRQQRMRLKNPAAMRFFWTAPEHLRQRRPHLAASKRGDIYALAIIFYEIFTRKEPYYFGTTAKPRWHVIRRDKLRHQAEQQQQMQQHQQEPQQNSSSLLQQQQQSHSRAGSTAGSIINMALGARGGAGGRPSLASLGSLKANGQGSVASNEAGQQRGASLSCKTKALARGLVHKRRQNSVGPQEEQEAGAETESCVSHSSSVASQLSNYKDAAQPTTKSRINALIGSLGGGSVVGVGAGAVRENVATTIGNLEEQREDEDEDKLVGSVTSRQKSTFKSKSRTGAAGDELDADEILDQLRMGIKPEPIRPYIPNYLIQDVDPRMVSLLRSCWHETPSARPSAHQVRSLLRRITKGATAKNYLDNLLDRLQTYAAQLERIVDSKSGDIMAEKKRTEELLYQLVPKFVADCLKRSEPIIPQVFESVTIFFSDIIGFQKYASVMSPCELVDLLNNIYSSFESIISSFDVTKIEVILDQFLVASGISLEQQLQPAQQQQLQLLQQHETLGASEAAPQSDSQQRQRQQQQQQTSSCTDKLEESKLSRQETGLKSASVHQARLKSRLLGALKSQSEDKGGAKTNKAFGSIDSAGDQKQQQQQQQQFHKSDSTDQGGLSGLDIEHYKRTSAEQIARMALCIRDLVKSFHFRQKLDPSEGGPGGGQQQGTTRQASLDQDRQQQQHADSAGVTSATVPKSGGGFVATSFNIRIGIHSGRVCAGIVGVKRPKYCLIGDTVNVASRMHTNSKANRIQLSSATRDLLRQVPGFSIEPRGRIEIKGKGLMETYWLESSY